MKNQSIEVKLFEGAKVSSNDNEVVLKGVNLGNISLGGGCYKFYNCSVKSLQLNSDNIVVYLDGCFIEKSELLFDTVSESRRLSAQSCHFVECGDFDIVSTFVNFIHNKGNRYDR